jgi:hypothetical protein
MEYQVVFDIASEGYKSWSFPTFGFLFITIGIGLVLIRKNLPGWWGKHPTASNFFTFCFLSFSVLWTAVSFVTTYQDYVSLSTAEQTNRVHVAEGVVTNFKPMPATGHAMERFCVSNKCFEYSDYVITGGFNNTSSHGGPIREGLSVRVSYVGDSIIKLEIVK